jgi:predicted permease
MEEELDEEVREHFERQIQANVDKGLSAVEARRKARFDFGGVEEVKEAARDARGVAFIETTFQDIRYALRNLRRQPGLVATATLSAALGIGVCTVVFGIVNLALFQQLPIQDPERLMSITAHGAHGMGQPMLSSLEVRAIRGTASWESVAYGLPFIPGSLGPSGGVKPAWGALVSGNYFDVVKPSFSLGRGFVDGEDDVKGATPKVVLSHSVWSERYGSDESLLGQDILVNGRRMMLTGVTGPGFKGTTAGLVIDYYLPLSQINELPRSGEPVDLPDDAGLWLPLGRLRPGIDLTQTAAELELVQASLLAQFPERNEERGFGVTPASQALDAIVAGTRPLFLLLLAVSALVLLTACANVANLLLARASMRGPELSTRLALGAGRSRILRQLLTESVLLSSAGGLLGVCFASWAGGLGGSLTLPFSIPIDLTLPTDYRTAAVAVALCFASGVLFGLMPALRSTKTGVFDGLRSNTGSSAAGFRRFGLRNGLAAAQVAMSTALLVCALLFVRSFGQATQAIVGNLNPEGVTVIAFDPAMSGYDAVTARELLGRILQRAKETPGVLSASITDAIPNLGTGAKFATEPIGENTGVEGASVVLITPAVLQTLGIRLVDGEGFDENSPNRDSMILDESMAQALFPNGGAVGSNVFKGSGETYRIIGVARNVSVGAASRNIRPPHFVYRPLLDSYSSKRQAFANLSLLLKLSPTAPPPSLISQDVLIGLDPNLVVGEAKTLEALLRETFMFIQLPAILFSVCGLMGLAISAIGVYGIMSFAVARRSKEIGIRLALGAEASRIVLGVVSHGTAVTLTGLVVGLAGGYGLARLAGSFVVGVTPRDPVTYAAVSAIIAVVALAASAVPASRAASIDPARTLRSE